MSTRKSFKVVILMSIRTLVGTKAINFIIFENKYQILFYFMTKTLTENDLLQQEI